MSAPEKLLRDLPDIKSARRFLGQLSEKFPSHSTRLQKNEALLSDVLTLVSFSPLLAATLLQNPEYIWWLNRKRSETLQRTKADLLESLARFALTNSQIDPQVLLARFRRRELLRIFLRDIRRLATIAEITEDISNLADAILEHTLRIARQELDNRYGSPLETDAKGKQRPADFCIVSLGKLGSKELNYASDIDLLFIYSGDGSTSGSGQRGVITNREYFVKLAESITKLAGQHTGEGAAYRVDLRLRPHGRVGPLALPLGETTRYYISEAAKWERQVLIRSRPSAGDAGLFKQFVFGVEDSVFSKNETVEDALRNVRLSKEKIDLEHGSKAGFDVKLGSGGIREIEFIAQALQLAHGGRDRWLRAPHTLISLDRLADRKHLSERDLTMLYDAYEFLRHLEHIIQMENGLQTHRVPNEPEKRALVARRMSFLHPADFESLLQRQMENVSRVFTKVFGEKSVGASFEESSTPQSGTELGYPARFALAKPDESAKLRLLTDTSPRISEILSANPSLQPALLDPAWEFAEIDYRSSFKTTIVSAESFGRQLASLRKTWTAHLLEIIAFDVLRRPSPRYVKTLQTSLAEASIEAALQITASELERRLQIPLEYLNLAVLGLGKLGGGGVDYDSDLDLVLAYDETINIPGTDLTHAELYARAVEIFVTVLSSITRDGSVYRVDLRLRPYGKNGASSISQTAMIEYLRSTAAVWELLAFVKIRAVGGRMTFARSMERSITEEIRERAEKIEPAEVASETHRVRMLLEAEKSAGRRSKDIDIKYGSGGMLDIYFAVRFMQLRDSVSDGPEDRSTDLMLRKLVTGGSLASGQYDSLSAGYDFLSSLDHNLRLTSGRSTRLPFANKKILRTVAERMMLGSVDDLLEKLTLHRLNIRQTFDEIVKP